MNEEGRKCRAHGRNWSEPENGNAIVKRRIIENVGNK